MGRKTEYHTYVTEEKWNKVNDENKSLYNDFIEYLQSVDRSPKTILNYESDLKIFFCWYMEKCNNKSFIDIKKRDVMSFQSYLLNTMKLSSNRIRRLRSTISSLSNFITNILDDEYPEFRNIINKIEAPVKEPVREKTVLTDEQVHQLLDTLKERREYQKMCVVAACAASGVRKAELLELKMSFFNDDAVVNGLYKTPKIRTKGRGKAGKKLNKYFIKAFFKPYFDIWVEERKKLSIDCDDMFVVKHDDKWQCCTISTLDKYTKEFSEILGVPVYLHALRHFYATELARNNISLRKIKGLMGHQSIETSEIYIDIDEDEDLEDIFDENGIIPQKKNNEDDKDK